MDFADLERLALHFVALEVAVQEHAERGLDKALEVIEKEAKAELGHYQPEVGPFNAWPELAESTLKHHEALGVGESPLLVHGGLYASIEHERHGPEGVVGSKEDVAAYQELGTATIPPRPFIGPAAFKSQAKVEKVMGEAAVKGLLYGAVGAWTGIGHDSAE